MKMIWLGLLAFFAACTPLPEKDLRSPIDGGRERNPNLFYYKIMVDSVAVGSTGIQAMGVIGSNGCHRFEYVESERSGSSLHLTFWGSRPVRQDVICTMQIPYMSEAVGVDATVTEVIIHQPDGSTLRRSLPNRR